MSKKRKKNRSMVVGRKAKGPYTQEHFDQLKDAFGAAFSIGFGIANFFGSLSDRQHTVSDPETQDAEVISVETKKEGDI